MGLFSRQEARQARQEPRIGPAPETRSTGYVPALDSLAALHSGAGTTSPHMAENLAAVQGAISIICGGLASLPASLQQDTVDGRQLAPATSPAWRVLSRPSKWQSWPAFVTAFAGDLLLRGNALAWVQRDGRGAPVALVQIPWSWVGVQVVKTSNTWRVAYDIAQSPQADFMGLPRRLLDNETMHVRGRSDDGGLIGRSALHRAAGVIREGLTLAQLVQNNWSNGVRPSGWFKSPTVLTEQNRAAARVMMDRFAGVQNVGKTPLMEGNWEFVPNALTSVDAELLASRRLSTDEIARIFGLPSAMLSGGNAGPGYDQLLSAYAQQTLIPIVNLIECEFDYACLPASLHLQLDTAGLQRGNYSAVAAAQATLVQAGVASPNDGRRALSLPAVEGGDALRVGAAPNFPADAAGVPSLAPKPGPTGDGLPNIGTNQNGGSDG